MNLLSPDSVFRRALCAQVCLSFNMKTPKLWRENMFSVSAAPISPAKIHLGILKFFFFKASEALLRWNLPPPSVFPLWSLRFCFLLQTSRNKRRENSSHGRASCALGSCSWTLVDSSSCLTPIHRVQVLILLLFPFTRTHLFPFYSSVHTLAFYYSSSDWVGRIH